MVRWTATLVLVTVICSAETLASDPHKTSSMEQCQSPVEAMRAAIRKLSPGMSIEDAQRILGVNLGFGIWDRRGIASWQITMPFQGNYELSVQYDSEVTSTRLMSAELKYGDRIIAKMHE